MGGSACQVIIDDGNYAYGILSGLANTNSAIKINMLEAALLASCQGSHHASSYFLIEGQEEKFSQEYSQPIIDVHHKIIHQLPQSFTQAHVDKLANELFKATKALEELYKIE